jgi:hypothetical protein
VISHLNDIPNAAGAGANPVVDAPSISLSFPEQEKQEKEQEMLLWNNGSFPADRSET